MNNKLPDRLLRNRLTDVGQYRDMKKALADSEKPIVRTVSEDWKDWELVPVTAGAYSSTTALNVENKTAASLQKALLKLD